jgi:(1->4)-alpha-D-glucan 1-alpha-D-glucosylmutase
VQAWAWERRNDPAVAAFVARVAEEGERAALGQLLLKLTTPGIPDVYQGDELWDLSLVDPDNRRPVDWEARRAALEAVRDGAAPTRATRKLHLIHRALELRARRPEAFGRDGAYRPLDAGEDVCAFVRGDAVLAVAPLKAGVPAALAVPADLQGPWKDVLTGAPVGLGPSEPVASLLADGFGLALLERA